MHLHVDKPDTMQIEQVQITANELEPDRVYTMNMILKHNYGTHSATATFRSNSKGYIDLTTDAPIRGTYSGVEPMGLFMSQRPHEDFAFGGYLRCTPPLPFYYDLILYDEKESVVDQITIKKHWMHPKLERTEIAHDGFYGTLFKPPGKGPFPTILDMSGTGGGIHEHKGSMLASEGFVVLCVAFFQFKDLVSKLEDVDIDYFKKPVDFLLNLPYTEKRFGIQGVSFGGTLVDLICTRYPEFKAAVVINGPHVQNHYCNLKEHGQPMPAVFVDDTKCYFLNGLMNTHITLKTSTPLLNAENETQWHRIPRDCKFRLVGSMDDLCSPSVHTTYYRKRRLEETGHDVEVELVGGGHIMEPPYFPHHEHVYAKFQAFYCAYGGEVVLHGKSQERTWANTIKFFVKTLGAPRKMPDWDRQTHVVNPRLAENRSHL
ncbi:unnamed protein product [Caenorhabditis auriculariae]|uniref:BAAT/Acyl-CoA thioester hydrolase C-terminal domain-containing protein n=1 Tax=Caenorhabditis auriculariae TaxID=2777116 RepID=A0A8S1GNR6_9PELO|nr:unnamed protein product [Caenorhabditis auriculariae]